MILRKSAAFYYPFFLRAHLALLTTSAALDLSHVSPSSFSSFALTYVAKPSTAASSDELTIFATAAAACTADHFGGAVLNDAAVYSSLLHGKETSFSRLHFAAFVLRRLKAAVTVAAVYQVTSLLLFAVAVSAEDRQIGQATPPTSDETLLTKFVRQISSIEIPTFSAVLSSGVDRIASAIFFHFFPNAQLPPGTLLSGTSFSFQKTASQRLGSTPVGSGRADGRTADGTAEGVFATGKGVAAGATAGDVKGQVSAPVPIAASSKAARAASVAQAPRVLPRPVPPAYCSISYDDRCSWIPPSGGGQKVFTSPSLDGEFFRAASNDSSSPKFFSPSESLTFVPSSSSFPRSTAAAQTQQVCTSAARQQGTCTSSTAAAPQKRFSSFSVERTGENFKEATGSAMREDSGPSLSAAAPAAVAPVAGDERSPAQLLDAGGAAAREGIRLNSPLLASAATAGANAEISRSQLLSSASAAASAQQQPEFPLPGRAGLPYGEVELLGNLFEMPRNSNASPSFVDFSDVQGFLSSIDLLDPLLLVLLGFHLLLVAAVLCCRRMHAAQLLLLCFVSLLLLCSKQMLLLCSLVEQRLRTDDSLASAIAAFASSTPPSFPSSSSSSSLSAAAPQFYCSPSAAARATLFLLLFWWLPLFTALLLLVGALLQELVASLRILTTRKAKATKRHLRSGDETAAAATPTLCLSLGSSETGRQSLRWFSDKDKSGGDRQVC